MGWWVVVGDYQLFFFCLQRGTCGTNYRARLSDELLSVHPVPTQQETVLQSISSTS